MLKVNIVSQETELLQTQASFITAPATMGEVGIKPGHAPFLSTLKQGQVSIITEDGSRHEIFVSGGFIEVQPKAVTILSDTAISASNMDEEKLLENQRQAQELLERAKSDIDIAKAETMVANSAIKIEMASKLRDKLSKKGY